MPEGTRSLYRACRGEPLSPSPSPMSATLRNFASVRQAVASILLVVFVGFLASISTHFSLYVKVLNGGSLVEDVNSIPEEHNENLPLDSKLKTQLYEHLLLLVPTYASDVEYYHHQFALAEGVCMDVPYPPPELA